MPQQQPLVLIVEDHADLRLMMAEMLKNFGYAVIEAGNGFEAIEKTKEHNPDIILMDVFMPELDGLSAARIIREDPRFFKTPIIIVTADTNIPPREVIEVGCNDLFRHPLNFEKFEIFLKQYL